MNIRGKEINFKLSRLKDAGNYELALKKMEQTEKEIAKKQKTSEVIAGTINMLRQFMIDATGVDVLKDCDDVIEAKEVYYEFLKNVTEQKEQIIKFSADDIK